MRSEDQTKEETTGGKVRSTQIVKRDEEAERT